MADPICRWRNPTIGTVLELISFLPKEEFSKNAARDYVNNRSQYDFYRTPYQLACQLGLYYEEDNRFFPKFTFTPSEPEVTEYLKNWIIHYSVPNPYTRSLPDIQPFSIHAEICRRLRSAEHPIDWDETKSEMFHQEIGNNDILVNAINTYSPIIEITGGIVSLRGEADYSRLDSYTNVDVSGDRNNKEYFFDLFQTPSRLNQNDLPESNGLITDVSREERDVVMSVEENPTLTRTEKNQIVAARIGQGLFRRNLILNCGTCPITGVDDSRLLIASHIKPWRLSDNDERISFRNGLLFTPTYDKLFDKGFISFTNNRRIILSPLVSAQNAIRLNLTHDQVYPNLAIGGREEYMEFHRDQIFKAV